jgi:hypothetical protein
VRISHGRVRAQILRDGFPLVDGEIVAAEHSPPCRESSSSIFLLETSARFNSNGLLDRIDG